MDASDEVQDEDELKSLLQMQLDEILLLQSMYPSHSEFELDDPQVLTTLQGVVENDRPAVAERLPCLSFTLHFIISLDGKEHPAEIWFSFPNAYPRIKPLLNIRCLAFSRESQRQCSTKLLEFLDSLDEGEPATASIIQWVNEFGADFVSVSQTAASAKQGFERTLSAPSQQFCRIWLYMHHIYNKHKRKVILEWAQELKLTGFCLPGKPGVVCAEGDMPMVDEYFHRLRRMNWKRITCRHREEETGDVDSLRLFDDFPELNMDAHGGHHNHMDMGLFYQYLEKHSKGEMFSVLFGVEGRATADS